MLQLGEKERKAVANHDPEKTLMMPGQLPPKHYDRWALLAGLRFVLSSIVMIGHISSHSGRHDWTEIVGKLSIHAAVIGFLMVSGYSIAHSISQKPDKFLVRRFHRIYWVYLATMLYSIIPFVLIGHIITLPNAEVIHPPTTKLIIGNLLMLQGFLVPVIQTNGVNWSLSVECFYYITAPLLVKLTNRILFGIVVVSAVVECLPLLVRHVHNPLTRNAFGNVVLLAWAWVGGFAYQRAPKSLLSMAMLLLPGCVLMLMYYQDLAAFTVVASALLIIYADRIPLTVRVRKSLDYLGDLSYPLYLIHIPTIILIWAVWHIYHPLLMLTASLGLTALCYHLVDLPSRRLVRKLLSPMAVTQSGTLH